MTKRKLSVRKLELRRETLLALSGNQLEAAVGGKRFPSAAVTNCDACTYAALYEAPPVTG